MEISELYQKYLDTGSTVSTDTRRVIPGSVFFALKGERFDANQFASDALNSGAKFAVVSDPSIAKDDRYIVVPDTLVALQQLARYHREELGIPVIGLTGSNGKTTSKELLNAVLSKKFKTYCTQGNLNNHIGVPLTILAINKSVEVAVVEMGANHVGEIASLCEIANPTHGFITNIGKAHIGTFGGFDNIIRGKSELYQHLLTHGGVVFINSQNPILANMAKRFSNPILYPASGDYYTCTLLGADPFIHFQTEDGDIVQTQLIGAYNFENIAAALCIGKYFQVEAQQANKAVAEYVAGNMRSQVIRKGNNTIILDAYNANPSSMKAALENLNTMQAEKKVVILGDMFELEDEAEHEHRALGELLGDLGYQHVYLIGNLIKSATAVLPHAHYFSSKEELLNELKKNPLKNSTILVKASRGIGLESVVDVL